MNKKLIMLSLATAGILFTGCGGSSGVPAIGSGDSKETISIKGFAIDPEIQGANVSVECDGLRAYNSSQTTDENGAFIIHGIPQNTNLSTCTIISKGGIDSGENLEDITFKAPYSMYNSKENIYITPLTTLVSEHDDYKTGNEETKKEVKKKIAKYFGLNEEDLIKNPISIGNIKIAKVTKKITKTALAKDKTSKKIGVMNINNVDLNNEDFNDYLTNTVKPKMNPKKFAALDKSIKKSDTVTSIEEMRKNSIIENTIEDIKSSYHFFEDEDDNTQNFYEANKEKLDKNIEYMAQTITEKNKKAQSTRYRTVSSFHLRKALADLELRPLFEQKDNKEIDYLNLSDELEAKLLKNESDFQTYVNSKNINIIDIKNFILYDSKTYEKQLGVIDNLNTNITRKDYYIHSDISNVAKALSLAENNLSDSVNDPINSLVASALGKFGFYDDAISHIESNIYQNSEKQKAYRLLGRTLLALGKNEEAAKAFSKEYKLVKELVDSMGKAELGNSKNKVAKELRNALIEIARYLGTAGFYEDDNQKNIIGSNTVTSYLSSVASLIKTSSAYSLIVTAIDNLAVDVYYYTEDLVRAKNIFKENLTLIDNFPTDNKAGIYHLYKMAIHANIYGLDASKAVEKAHSNELNPGNTHTELKDNYGQYPIIYEALTGEIKEAITQLSKLRSSYQDDAIQNGMGAALFLRGRKDELFDTYYGDDFYYDRTKKDFLMSKNVFIKPSGAIMSTMQMIKIKGGNEELKDYLNRLVTLAQTWYVISDKEEDKKNNISDPDAQKVYGMWGSAFTSKYGYMAIASMYKSINEEDKAKDTISKAIEKVNAFSDVEKKIVALINIWNAIKELGYSKDFDIKILLEGLESSALNSDLDSDEKYTKQRVEAANILSLNGKKDEAKAIIQKAYAVIPTLIKGNKTNVETRFSYLAGNYEDRTINFQNSIANAYFQAVGASKAKEIIQEAYDAIKTLGSDGNTIDTETQYDYLVSIALAYGKVNDLEKAKEIISLIKTKEEKDEAIKETAEALATYDAFSSTNIASIDFDEDGKPDFFDIQTENKGSLELDKDIDNDGVEDDTDNLPYNKEAK